MILTLFLRYSRSWNLWDEAMRAGTTPPEDALHEVESEFVPAMAAFATGWLVFAAAAAVAFVAVLSGPVCRGRRYAV